MLAASRKSGNVRAALAAVKEIRSLVESQAKLLDAARGDPANAGNEARVLVYLPDNGRGDTVHPEEGAPPPPLADVATLEEDGTLTIRLTPAELAAAVVTSPRAAFWMPDGTRCQVTIEDQDQLAAAVLDELRQLDDAGRTLVHALVDLAVSDIISRRAAGLQIEHVTD